MRGIIKKMRLINHHADYTRQPFQQMESVGVLKGEMLVAEEKGIGGQQLPFHKARC